MKKTKLFVGMLIAAGCLSVYAASGKDPVLMKVNGEPVTLSEFEYMYHKNNQQQMSSQPLDKYVDMFSLYKMKVADAKAEGIDTTAAFRREFEGYRNELAAPYLVDTAAEEALLRAIYERMHYNVKASHIMHPKGKDAASDAKNRALLDSLRTCVLNGESFDSLALRYSVDQSVVRNKGSMGYVSVGRFPYQFEEKCFETPVGEVSEPFTTSFGWHIVKTFEKVPDAGKVEAAHILKLYPRNATDEQKAEVRRKMDIIYKQLKDGADFEELARKESEDPGSASKGGVLPAFGRGMMVPEFEKVSFELKPGEISEPFETAYGVHVVKKIGMQPLAPYAEVRDNLLSMIKRDERGLVGRNAKLAELKKQYKLERNEAVIGRMTSEIAALDSLDAGFVSRYATSNETLFTLGGKTYPVSLLAESLSAMAKVPAAQYASALKSNIDMVIDREVAELEKQRLETKDADFRNLVNEYRDGMLLFEVSNRKVWNKASADREGLEAFFEKNRNDYKWTSPKCKGILVQTTGDSISQAIKVRIAGIEDNDTIVKVIRKEFGKDAKVERVLVDKGENKLVDSEIFGAPRQKLEGKMTDYFLVDGRLISKPEDLRDVMGQVIADYQTYLENEWVAYLKKTYPVEVNKKVLKMVK